jgi:hypothetical protein
MKQWNNEARLARSAHCFIVSLCEILAAFACVPGWPGPAYAKASAGAASQAMKIFW